MTARLVKYALPVVALVLFAVAVAHVMSNSRDEAGANAGKPVVTPSVSPYSNTVAGSGIVEPRTQNIAVGAPLPGIVTQVFVHVGEKVKAGDKLFRLDDRELQAKLRIQEAALAAARADLERLEHSPRPEEVPVLEAQVREAEALAADKQQQLNRLRRVAPGGAVTEDELQTAQYAAEAVTATFEQMKAELYLLKAGTWEYEKKVAQAAVARAEAEVANVQTDLDRLVVTAPVDSEILQVNVRPGEYVGASREQELVILGNTEELHIRIDIDENDIPRYRLGAPATASLRGDPEHQFPLAFVRVEPLVVPKRSLTGDNSERVDTRVLQLIYRVASPEAPQLYVGQQVDAYIDVEEKE